MSYLKTYTISIFIQIYLNFKLMITQNIALYSWTNGAIMIAVFGIVCLILIGVLINFMMGGKKKEESEE
jgi:hypothetical protein